LPVDEKNLSLKQTKLFEKDKRFLLPLYIYMALDFAAFIWALYTFVYGEFYGIVDRFLLIYSVSHFAALEMVIGHELLHRRQLVHKIFGTLAYSKVLYSHFFIEHIKGHHKHVATPLDPATSELGEHLYEFFPRSFFGSYKSVWKYETERLSKRDMSGFMKLLNNRLISFNIGHVIYLIVINYIFGYMGLIFVLAYSFVSVFMLETINYIEHYGLQRSKDENGIYEPINIKHSWNAPHRYTNYILFKLQRHSDHHANAYKPYQILSSFKDSPTMLGGYSLALITAYCPPVWFKAYDPIVKAVKEDRDITPEELKKCENTIYKYLA
jgi:alkane 1-monooxygenase